LYNEWIEENKAKAVAVPGKSTASIFDKKVNEIDADNYVDNLQDKYKYELSKLNMNIRGNGIVHSTLRRIVFALRHTTMSEDEVYDFMEAHSPHGMTAEIEQLVYSRINQ
jgi:hypothetical protein